MLNEQLPSFMSPCDDHETEWDEFAIAGRTWRSVSCLPNTYWQFATERQDMFFHRLHGDGFVTDDPILKSFKFTNAYRASDRVSQYLIKRVAYQGLQTPEEFFFLV